ncbi:MAG TPA: hypothetical protein VK002_07440 [Rubricoccaceae bacterium]|nr:hypothetical protein [Rubricoccaceae bacterium]
MAKTNANDTPNAGPPAEPTAASDPAAPDASIEPEAQAVAAAATTPGAVEGAATTGGTAGSDTGATARPAEPVLPPAPADYAMPDDYETDTFGQVRRWVEDNPVLAIAAAAGLGLAIGRLVTALIPEPEPPTFAARVEKRAKQIRKDAAVYADDAGDVLAANLKKAANALSDAAEVVAEKAEVGYEKSKDLAEVVGDAVKAAVAGVVAKKADGWLSRLRD